MDEKLIFLYLVAVRTARPPGSVLSMHGLMYQGR